MAEKPNIDGFQEWARSKLGFDPLERPFEIWVNTNVQNARAAVDANKVLSSIQSFISGNQASKKRSRINIIGDGLNLDVKSYKSIVSKLYRQNVSQNANFPDPPPKGWVTPETMFSLLNDLVRTTIVCRHIDEPAKIAEAIENFAEDQGLEIRKNPQAKEHGYYAYHLYLKIPATLVKPGFNDYYQENIQFEIQVTTQMQHMLYELTHVFYDRERDLLDQDKDSWKWDYKSARFSASYLSHTLHMLEGMILRLYEEVESNPEENPLKSAGETDYAGDVDAIEGAAEKLLLVDQAVVEEIPISEQIANPEPKKDH